MKSTFAFALLVSAATATSAFAQIQPAAQPAILDAEPAAAVAAVSAEGVLPSNTDVVLRLTDMLSTRTNRTGDTFPLTVVSDVLVDGRVVIPSGTRAVGQVTWRTGRGGFGKSGKMEIALRYIELNGQRIPVTGFHRQEGDGNTAGTIGATLAAGVIGGMLVHGSHARIPAGREFTVRTVDAIPVTLGEGRLAAIAVSYRPTAFGTDLGRRRDAQATAPRCGNGNRAAQSRREARLARECREQLRSNQT
ncbi:MAG TPA: hypothetical protein VD887_04275 [Allosphingosinicella sp.]|nr:hypothetical protein [Allosphingosinicella sp.]